MAINTPPIFMPVMALVLLLLPVKLDARYHLKLAFALWFAGGLVLAMLGLSRLLEGGHAMAPTMLGLAAAGAIAVGMAKGRFVLSKTSARNIDRINTWTEPQKPIHVYSIRSWVMIAIMIGISLSLTYVFHVDDFWRGLVNLAIGFALIMSSLNYIRAMANHRAAHS